MSHSLRMLFGWRFHALRPPNGELKRVIEQLIQ